MSAYKRNYGKDLISEIERERGERIRLEGKVAELEAKLSSVTAELTAKIEMLLGEVAKRDDEIARLKTQIGKDSSNSSKPPSSNGLKKVPNSREKSGKKQGGQKGHKGSTLIIPENLNELVAEGKAEHEIIIAVSEGEPWVSDWEIDIKTVTVYKETRRAVGAPPRIEYGKNTKGLTVYLSTIGLIAFKRLSVVLSDISGGLIRVSKATLQKFNHELAENVDLDALIHDLLNGTVMHVDETPVRTTERRTLNGALETSQNSTLSAYVRTYSNLRTTVLTPNAYKNTKSVKDDNILPRFCGVVVQDYEAKFLKYGTQTALCGAHLSRQLKGLAELEKIAWANDVRQFFQTLNEHKNADIQVGVSSCNPDILCRFESEYDKLVDDGRVVLATLKPKTYMFKILAPMVKRLSERKSEYMLFIRDYSVPYTNNLAERDLRHCKTKQKISGCYRSWQGLVDYCKLRSLFDTARKRGQNLLDSAFSLCSFSSPAGQ